MIGTQASPWRQPEQNDEPGLSNAALSHINTLGTLPFDADDDRNLGAACSRPVESVWPGDANHAYHDADLQQTACWTGADASMWSDSSLSEGSFDPDNNMGYFADLLSWPGMLPSLPSSDQGYNFGAASVSNSFDPGATTDFVDLSHLDYWYGAAEMSSNAALSPFATIESPTAAARNEDQTMAEPQCPPSVETDMPTLAPKSPKLKRKRGRPRLFTVADAPESQEDEPQSPATRTSPPHLPQVSPSKVSSTSVSRSTKGTERQNARERNRKAATRYRNKLQSLSDTLEEEVASLQTQNRSLTTCRDELLKDVYDLKHTLLWEWQSRGNNPAVQAYFQTELQRRYGHLATNPMTTVGSLAGVP